MREHTTFDGDPDGSSVDQDDPEFQEEMFQVFRAQGTPPERLRDDSLAARYRAWLQAAPLNHLPRFAGHSGIREHIDGRLEHCRE